MATYKPHFKFAMGATARPFKPKPVRKREVWSDGMPISVRIKDLQMVRAQLHNIWFQAGDPSKRQTKYIKHNLVQLRKLVESILRDAKRRA